jgi:uncharacterized protein YcbK (DUF882 family)
MRMITPHFSYEEAGCHDGTSYPIDWVNDKLFALDTMLEKIRVRAGNLPITIDSCYRTIAYDTKIYESEKVHSGLVAPPTSSQHPKGRAADIRHETMSSLNLFNLIMEMYQNNELPELGGIGLYLSFVHVDIRPRINNHLTVWGGSRPDNVV